MTPWSELYSQIEPQAVGCPLPLIDQQLFIVAREFCDRTLANRARYDLAYRVGTGAIAAGSNELTFAGDDLAILAGDPVVVKGAGVGGRNLDAKVLSVDGSVAVLDRRADTLVVGSVVSAPSYLLPLAAGDKLLEVATVRSRETGQEIDPIPEEELDERRPGWRDELAPEPAFWTLDFFRRLYLYRAPDAAGSVTVEAILTVAKGALGIPDALADEWGHALAAGTLARLLVMSAMPWSDPASASVQQGLYQDAVSEARSRARRHNMRTVKTANPASFGGLR